MATRVYVGRLPYDVRERDIEKFFRGYGRIREVLIKDGFAFVVSSDVRLTAYNMNVYMYQNICIVGIR